MNNQGNLVKNIFSLGVVQVANYVLPLVSIPIIVRIIGPANYGIINYYNSFIAYFILLINYGFDYSGTRYIAIEKGDIAKRNLHFTKVLYAKGLLFIASAIVFSVSVFFVARSPDEARVGIYTFLIAISWVLSPNWFYQGMQQLTRVALFNFSAKLVFTVAILLVIRKKDDFMWQPLILSLTQITVSLVSLVYAVRKFKIALTGTDLRSVLALLWDDRMIFLSMLATNLYTDTNIVVLGLFETREHVGYFTAAWKLIFVFLVLLSFPISQALFPYIAETLSTNISKGLDHIRRILPMIIYMALGFSAVLYLSAPIVIREFYGGDFKETILIFRILTLVPVLSFINTVLGLQTMVNLKMDRAYFTIIFSGGVFSVLFNLTVIHFYGYHGAAWSWITAEVVITIILHRYLKGKGFNMFIAQNFSPKNVVMEFKGLISNFRKRTI